MVKVFVLHLFLYVWSAKPEDPQVEPLHGVVYEVRDLPCIFVVEPEVNLAEY